jgi:hypothetical protein
MARAKGEREHAAVRERVKLHQADMTSFELKRPFQLAIIPFRAFQHLTLPEQQRAALNCINRSLVVGGHLIIGVVQRPLAPLDLLPFPRVELNEGPFIGELLKARRSPLWRLLQAVACVALSAMNATQNQRSWQIVTAEIVSVRLALLIFPLWWCREMRLKSPANQNTTSPQGEVES